MSNIVNDFVQGDTPTWGVTVYSDEDKTTTVDTTGYTVYVTLKTDRDLTDASASLQVSSITTSADGANGIISVRATKAESASLSAGVYEYDFQVITDDDIIDTLEDGRVRVTQAVTLATS